MRVEPAKARSARQHPAKGAASRSLSPGFLHPRTDSLICPYAVKAFPFLGNGFFAHNASVLVASRRPQTAIALVENKSFQIDQAGIVHYSD